MNAEGTEQRNLTNIRGSFAINRVSVLTLRPAILVKTLPGNTPVKQKKRRFDSLSDGK
jgi:hypothetical protein